MADQVLTRDGPVSVPMEYTVPQGGELIPLVVNATLDGSAAASAFYGAVQIIAPSGRVMGSAITSSIAAGASASPTWFPRVGGGSVVTPISGEILGIYLADHTAPDFTWVGPAAANVSSGYPANNTLTKQDANSVLQVLAEGDFVATGAPDQIEMGLWIDGVNQINVAVFTSIATPLISVQVGKNIGAGTGVEAPLSAGAHTLDMKVSSFNGINTTFRCLNAASLTIIEFVP